MNPFQYIPQLRPASKFTLPSGVEWRYVAVSSWLRNNGHVLYIHNPHTCEPWVITDHRYGIIEINRELTDDECEHFGLVPVPVKTRTLRLYYVSPHGVKVEVLKRDITRHNKLSVDSTVVFENNLYTWDGEDGPDLTMCQVDPNLVFVV